MGPCGLHTLVSVANPVHTSHVIHFRGFLMRHQVHWGQKVRMVVACLWNYSINCYL